MGEGIPAMPTIAAVAVISSTGNSRGCPPPLGPPCGSRPHARPRLAAILGLSAIDRQDSRTVGCGSGAFGQTANARPVATAVCVSKFALRSSRVYGQVAVPAAMRPVHTCNWQLAVMPRHVVRDRFLQFLEGLIIGPPPVRTPSRRWREARSVSAEMQGAG